MTAAPTRPILRYHGGKWMLAPWIIRHLPPHRVYVEPFGGAASVLLRKPRSYAEVYNDLDGDVVNLFHVVREHPEVLEHVVTWTPWSREEFDRANEPAEDPVERARRMIVRAFMGYASTGVLKKGRTGFRATSYRATQTGVADWVTYPPTIRDVAARMRGVCIESRDALEVVAQQDAADTLFYVDPPYSHGTRTGYQGGQAYAHELDDDGHRRLGEVLGSIEGMAVVSGYRCDLYDEVYAGWRRVDRSVPTGGNVRRTESLWISPRADRELTTPLFRELAP